MRRTISATALACLLIFATVAMIFATVAMNFATVAMAFPWDPDPDFSVSPNPAVRNSATTFESTGTCPDDPCTYRWTHGDAASTDLIGTGTTASFTYKGPPGTRTVTLTVTDRRNRRAVLTRSFQLVEPSSPPPTAQCSDGRDNDGDALTDYPADPGCSSATDNDEANVVVPPPPPSGGVPGPGNTGVPPGTTLTKTGGITVRTPGTVIDGVDAPGIDVQADNVTIKNSYLHGADGASISNDSGHTGLLIEDSTINSIDGDAIIESNYTALRLDVFGSEHGFRVGDNVTLQDNWVHDLNVVAPNHTDGVIFIPGADHVLIKHNNISPQDTGNPAATAAIITYNSTNPNDSLLHHDVTIEDNRLDGSHAAFALYCPRAPVQRFYVNNNRMLRGVFGYTDACRVPTTATEFNGNVDDATGMPLKPG